MAISMQNTTRYNREKNCVVVHLLIILFGISAWIGINGIFIQTPVLINTSPEGWALPAYLVLVIQAANFGPLIYTILQYLQCKINEPWWILCLLVSGSFAMGLLSFFYSERTVIAGNEYSLVLFVLTFFNALVGCFSPVLCMPYLRNFHEKFLVSYFVGEGLSGVLPSVFALIQGIEDYSQCPTPKNDTDIIELSSNSFGLKFSPNEYFLFIFVILFASLTAFAILEYSPFVRSIKQTLEPIDTTLNEKQTSVPHDCYSNSNESVKRSLKEITFPNDSDNRHLTKQTQKYLFILLAMCCFFSHGFLPSIQSYSCLPYGNLAYKLSVTFTQFANPLICLLAFWLKVTSVRVINYISLVCLIAGSYVTYLALVSPAPPLQGTKLGIFLVIASWALLIGLISYLKLIIVSIFRNTEVRQILFNAGVIMQIGSAGGAIFSFVTINFTDYFIMHNDCT